MQAVSAEQGTDKPLATMQSYTPIVNKNKLLVIWLTIANIAIASYRPFATHSVIFY